MSPRRKPRRAATSQELVVLRNPMWEESIREILRGIVQWNRTRDGFKSGAEMRAMIAKDAESRLESLVEQENNRLGTA